MAQGENPEGAAKKKKWRRSDQQTHFAAPGRIEGTTCGAIRAPRARQAVTVQ